MNRYPADRVVDNTHTCYPPPRLRFVRTPEPMRRRVMIRQKRRGDTVIQWLFGWAVFISLMWCLMQAFLMLG